MTFVLIRYEWQLLGKRVVLTPLLLVCCLSLFAAILYVVDKTNTRFFTATLEMLIPLATGILVVAVTAHDPSLELQLTLPRSFAVTVLRRVLLVVGWTVLVTVIFSIILFIGKFWDRPGVFAHWPTVVQVLALQMLWLAPLLWFTTIGICLTRLTRSVAAATMILSMIWLVETVLFTASIFSVPAWLRQWLFLFPSTLAPQSNYWLANRLEILLTALVVLLPAVLFLRNTEGLLKQSQEDE